MKPTRAARTSLGAIAALAIACLAGCSDAASPVAPEPAVQQPSDLEGDPGLGTQIAAVRAATAAFHDVNAAVGAGYTDPRGRVCDEIAIGAMGIHSGHFGLNSDQVIDPLRPEVLLYLPKPGGGFRLVAVEYVLFVLLRDPATGVVAPWTSPDPWPSDYEVVTPTPQLFGETFQGPMPGHFPGMPWHWDLHAWVWANNPNGLFAQWNPSLSCD